MKLSAMVSCLLGICIAFLLLTACGQKNEPAPTSEDPLVSEGHDVFRKNCAICHSLVPEKVITGPSLAGVATRAGNRVEGFEARDYIYQSITDPDAYVVDGFQNLMPPNFLEKLKSEEINAVIAFLLTQE